MNLHSESTHIHSTSYLEFDYNFIREFHEKKEKYWNLGTIHCLERGTNRTLELRGGKPIERNLSPTSNGSTGDLETSEGGVIGGFTVSIDIM